ncbi:polysaccharide deacetylase family protein [Bacillus aerolatus]|uniref:Polysaccharide deacetylase family protein n=1 Tax=Bacillus aerolatus TaxID=2653354 RepID=A0A6I1FK76_9BACI|nr:polysaccharide deacetylase family protein [Bacillus aerolatus]KAB7709108.1 polysaccharide deacetylase family protein [Bacillus aerolatus]
MKKNIKLLAVVFMLLAVCFTLLGYQLNQHTKAIALAEQKKTAYKQALPPKQPPHEKAAINTKNEPVTPVFPQQSVQTNGSQAGKVVYLTFDDGPAAVTQDILALLDRYGAQATFFMLEPNMRHYPAAVQQMVKQGHAAGMHGVTHDQKKIYHSAQSVIDEMKAGQETLKKLTGLESYLIRTPYGSVPFMTPEYRGKVKEANFKMWDWTIDSLDWKFRSQQYVPHVINQLNWASEKQQPLVILLHEKTTTLHHLEQLLQYLQSNNYKMDILNEHATPFEFHS